MKEKFQKVINKWKILKPNTKKWIIIFVISILFLSSFIGLWGVLIKSLQILLIGGITMFVILGFVILLNLFKNWSDRIFKNSNYKKNTNRDNSHKDDLKDKKESISDFNQEYEQDSIDEK